MTTTTPAAALREALGPVAHPSALDLAGLMAAVDAVGEAQAVLEAAKLRVAAEVVRRSTIPGEGNPTIGAGYASAASLLAERWRIAEPAARRYCRVGDAISERANSTGDPLQAEYPELAAVLHAPLDPPPSNAESLPNPIIGVEQAAVIVRALDVAAPACSTVALGAGERALVGKAPGLTLAQLRTAAGQVRDRLDDDGILPREKRCRERRSLIVSTTQDGMTHVDWYLDPESAGYVVTAIDALVGRQLRAVRFRDPVTDDASHGSDDSTEPGGSVEDPPESRSMAQLRSDAATDVFRHLAACRSASGGLTTASGADAVGGTPPVTVIVRIGLDELRNGRGTGRIDGIPAPISAATARRMAADANIIPVVLGGPSEVLDLGRSRRLFSRAQKLALAERDGGCAFTGCPHPPSYTEAHHVRWWNAHGGDTDLSNGILLCTTHHHRVHADGWDIDIRNQVPYFIPPPHIDPNRRPRRGGQHHHAPGAA